MTRIILGKPSTAALLSDAQREQMYRLMDAEVEGFTEDNKAAWRKLWRRIAGLDEGELLHVDFTFPRSGPFHRRHMAIEQAIFNAQERFAHFEMLRTWLKIGAGWVTWAAGPKGGVVPIPKSISYSSADQEEFRKYHDAVLAFLRGDHAAPYLWPHLGDPHGMMDALLGEFDE